jgi:hypothetical protein
LTERTRKQLVRAGWVITIALALTNVVLIVLARRELATSGGDIIFASVGTVPKLSGHRQGRFRAKRKTLDAARLLGLPEEQRL